MRRRASAFGFTRIGKRRLASALHRRRRLDRRLRERSAGASCDAPAGLPGATEPHEDYSDAFAAFFAAFAAAFAARAAARFASCSGVALRTRPRARRMSATYGLRWAVAGSF